MHIRHSGLAALAAALATSALAGSALAQSAAPPAAPASPAPAAAAPAATAVIPTPSTVLGAKYVNIDGFIYGGMLPIGADKNLDAVRVLVKAADAMGQLRDNQYGADPHFGYYLVLGDTSLAMRIDADGTWNGQKAHVVFDWDYGTPGVRIDVTNTDTKARTIQVAANNLAWDEKTPGVYSGAATTSANERLLLGYLMPSEVVLEARDAANVMKASKDANARNVLTIPVPQLGAGVNNVVTFDTEGHPIHDQIAYNGHTYVGDFSEFLSDRMDMMVNFSHHVTIQEDGKPFADLELNWHQVNPYLIFPVPAQVASK